MTAISDQWGVVTLMRTPWPGPPRTSGAAPPTRTLSEDALAYSTQGPGRACALSPTCTAPRSTFTRATARPPAFGKWLTSHATGREGSGLAAATAAEFVTSRA